MEADNDSRRGTGEGAWARASAPIEGADPGRLPGLFLRGGAHPRGFWQRGEAWGAFAGSAATLRVRDGEDPFTTVRRRGARLLERVTGTEVALDGRAASHTEPDAGRPFGPPRLYGGFGFRAGLGEAASGGAPVASGEGPAATGWNAPSEAASPALPLARFELPELELRSDGDRCRLTALARRPAGTPREEVARAARGRLRTALARLEAAAERADAGAARPAHTDVSRGDVSVAELVSEEAWERSVEAVLEAIRTGEARKVVLARGLEVTFGSDPDPVAVFLRLRRLYPGCFPFLFQPAAGVAFLCASPELVGSRRGDCFHTTAVAGTTGRGRDAAEDDRLARELLESLKDRSEHGIGVRDLRERLAEAAGAPRVDAEPHILRLRGIQHLQTDLSVRLPGREHVLRMIRVVHPAAAVCGYPRAAALRILREREPVGRGWYAGPVGWFDAAGDGEFAPGLRSATVEGPRVRLFAGAGIVEGSDARAEWEETALKFRPIREALSLPTGEPAEAGREP